MALGFMGTRCRFIAFAGAFGAAPAIHNQTADVRERSTDTNHLKFRGDERAVGNGLAGARALAIRWDARPYCGPWFHHMRRIHNR
jgi:hypothetical protein